MDSGYTHYIGYPKKHGIYIYIYILENKYGIVHISSINSGIVPVEKNMAGWWCNNHLGK